MVNKTKFIFKLTYLCHKKFTGETGLWGRTPETSNKVKYLYLTKVHKPDLSSDLIN